MNNVISLYPKNKTPDKKEQTISLLKSLLERTESGEIIEFAAICTYKDGMIESCWSGYENIMQVVGSIEMLKQRMLK